MDEENKNSKANPSKLKSPETKDAGLEKHMNSKLFQRFLKKEGVKLQDPSLRAVPKTEEKPKKTENRANAALKVDENPKNQIKEDPPNFGYQEKFKDPDPNPKLRSPEPPIMEEDEEEHYSDRPSPRYDRYPPPLETFENYDRDEDPYDKMFDHPIFSPKEKPGELKKIPGNKYYSREQSSEELSPYASQNFEKNEFRGRDKERNLTTGSGKYQREEDEIDFSPEEHIPEDTGKFTNPDLELKGYSEHLNPGESYAYYDEPSIRKQNAKPAQPIIPPAQVPQLPQAMPQYPMPHPYMGYFPMYYHPGMPAPSLDIRPYDPGSDTKRKDEIEKIKSDYEELLNKKDEEIKKLNRHLENARLDYDELEERMNSGGDLERRFTNMKVERDMLDRKLRAAEEENDNLRHQLDNAKEDLEVSRNQNEDAERNIKNKSQDLERELRATKDTIDDLDRQLIKEKEKNINMTRKLAKKKDKLYQLENDLKRSEASIQRLERDLESARDQASYDSRQQRREIESLRRQVDSLSKELENTDIDSRRDVRSSKVSRSSRNETTRYAKEEKPLAEDWYKEEKPAKWDEKPLSDQWYKEEKPAKREEQKLSEAWYRDEKPAKRDFREERPKSPLNNYDEAQPPPTQSKKISEQVKARIGATVSTSVSSALSWETNQTAPPPPAKTKNVRDPNKEQTFRNEDSIQNLEDKLLNLQIDKKKLEEEFSKLPEHAKKISIIRRREEVEQELNLLNSNIVTIKNKIRQLQYP